MNDFMAQVKFPGKRWAAISEDAKDCILAMLEVDPSHRPTSQQVLQMAWLRSVAHTAPRANSQQDETSIRRDILDHLRVFANQSRMRRLLLGLMASSISGGEANKLLDHFYAMDSDFRSG
jgi:calcium-dependent protein kinase